jgi:hypothetical protein
LTARCPVELIFGIEYLREYESISETASVNEDGKKYTDKYFIASKTK